MELNDDDQRAWDEWVESFRRDALGKIIGSGVFLSLLAHGEWDVKFCAELGTAIMLDKPIAIVAYPGTDVPDKLRAVAEEIIEADLDTEEGMRLIAMRLGEFHHKHGIDSP